MISLTLMTFPTLHKGDIIDIIAPASKSLDANDIKNIRDFLLSWDLQPRIPENIYGEDLLCANSDEIRFAHLVDALTNAESKAVWCLRGGYGSARLVENLFKLPTPKHNKLFMGFSDITVLHLFLQQQWGWQTLHTPSARQVAANSIEPENISELRNIIFGKTNSLEFKLMPLNSSAKKPAQINSSITGGNLSLVQTSVGTPWQVDTKNKVVFLEEVDERGYRIDRALQHLKQANIFENVKAVILGDFIDGAEPNGSSLINPVLKRFAEETHIPVLSCPGIGHGKENRPLPLGTSVNLQTGENASLSIKIK